MSDSNWGTLSVGTRNVLVTNTSLCSFLISRYDCQDLSDVISPFMWPAVMNASPLCFRAKKTFPLSQVAERVCMYRVTCRFSLISVSLTAFCLVFTHRERNQLNLRYMLYLLFKKKKKHLWRKKKRSQSSIAWQCSFFCLCWEICHHTPTYYLEWEKRVDARTFSRL